MEALDRRTRFEDHSKILVPILEMLEEKITLYSFREDGYALLACESASLKWKTCIEFVRPGHTMEIARVHALQVRVLLEYMDRINRVSDDSIPLLILYLLPSLDTRVQGDKQTNSKHELFIQDSLITMLKMHISIFPNIFRGQILSDSHIEKSLAVTMTQIDICRNLLPPQHQDWALRSTEVLIWSELYGDTEFRAECTRDTVNVGSEHIENCPCTFIYQAIPNNILKFFGFKKFGSKIWNDFILAGDWLPESKLGSPDGVLPGTKTSAGLGKKKLKNRVLRLRAIFSNTFVFAMRKINSTSTLSLEESTANEDGRRCSLFSLITQAAIVFFGLYDHEMTQFGLMKSTMDRFLEMIGRLATERGLEAIKQLRNETKQPDEMATSRLAQ